jgi:hypothetical protein
VEKNAGHMEHMLHLVFDQHRIQGEWFDLGERDALALIRAEIQRIHEVLAKELKAA